MPPIVCTLKPTELDRSEIGTATVQLKVNKEILRPYSAKSGWGHGVIFDFATPDTIVHKYPETDSKP